MIVPAVFAGCLLFGLAAYQLVSVVAMMPCFYRRQGPPAADDRLPKAAILLALRGADPDLAEGLRRLMRQRYPNYELRIVVDGRHDPAWELVRRAIEETGAENVVVAPLRERLRTCSLHCSSLIQLVEELDESCEVVVLADGDLVAHDDWLRELVSPLVAEGVGLTHGNRWFLPPVGNMGSLVRYLWNAAALVPMHFFEIPWGGSLAIRTADLRRCGLVDAWRRALAVDAPFRNALKEHGLRCRFIPSLMMTNREECDLAGNQNFIGRQLTWTRLYQPLRLWATVVCHAVVTCAAMLLAWLLLLFGLVAGQWDVAAWAAGGLIAYQAAMGLLTAMLETAVRRSIRRRGESVAWLSPRILAKLPLAILLTQWAHLGAVLTVLRRRKIHWRGVTYQIHGTWNVRKMDDMPFPSNARKIGSQTSL